MMISSENNRFFEEKTEWGTSTYSPMSPPQNISELEFLPVEVEAHPPANSRGNAQLADLWEGFEHFEGTHVEKMWVGPHVERFKSEMHCVGAKWKPKLIRSRLKHRAHHTRWAADWRGA